MKKQYLQQQIIGFLQEVDGGDPPAGHQPAVRCSGWSGV
jgi:hypothetical protein